MKIPEIINLVKNLLHKMEVDRAVFFGVLSKMWGIVAGPVTAILIVLKFSPELQGYYYTFVTLLALQVFVELGLGTVIIQFASHEWSKLNLDKYGNIIGDSEALSKLVSLARMFLKWYIVGGVIVAFGLGLGGYIFFSKSPNPNINWMYPWLTLCLLTGVNICLVPMWSLLEGCNQVAKLYAYRFFQSLFSNSSIWIAILLGAKLWTASLSCIAILVCAAVFIRYKYWVFFKTLLFLKPINSRIEWHKDIFPMQWRIAISWVSGYFVFSLFTPVLFKFHGPVIAGQMGITWSLVGIITTISGAWLAPKVPKFGMFIAVKSYNKLDQLFSKITKIILVVSVSIGFLIWFFVFLLYSSNNKFAERFLPPLPTGIFLLAQIIIAVSLPASSYLRAHKKEPLLFLSVMSGLLIGISTCILGKYYSAIGMAIGYLLINIIIIPFVFVVWYYCKINWHKNNDNLEEYNLIASGMTI